MYDKPKIHELSWDSDFTATRNVKRKEKTLFKKGVIYRISGCGVGKPSDSGIRRGYWIVLDKHHPKSDPNVDGAHAKVWKDDLDKLFLSGIINAVYEK